MISIILGCLLGYLAMVRLIFITRCTTMYVSGSRSLEHNVLLKTMSLEVRADLCPRASAIAALRARRADLLTPAASTPYGPAGSMLDNTIFYLFCCMV